VIPSLFAADVVKMVCNAFPEMKGICELVEFKIYNPMKLGQAPFFNPKAGEGNSFYQLLLTCTPTVTNKETSEYLLQSGRKELKSRKYRLMTSAYEMQSAQQEMGSGPSGLANRENGIESDQYRTADGEYESPYPLL
jgi:hypothetical protein